MHLIGILVGQNAVKSATIEGSELVLKIIKKKRRKLVKSSAKLGIRTMDLKNREKCKEEHNIWQINSISDLH